MNDEFSALETFLRHLPACLNPGGRAAVLTFHSGEDRRVKKSFEEGLREGVYAEISGRFVRGLRSGGRRALHAGETAVGAQSGLRLPRSTLNPTGKNHVEAAVRFARPGA